MRLLQNIAFYILTDKSAMTLLEEFLLVSLLLVLSVTALQAQGLYTFT